MSLERDNYRCDGATIEMKSRNAGHRSRVSGIGNATGFLLVLVISALRCSGGSEPVNVDLIQEDVYQEMPVPLHVHHDELSPGLLPGQRLQAGEPRGRMRNGRAGLRGLCA